MWLQRNVALTRDEGDPRPSARRLFDALGPVLRDLRAAGDLDRFFFQRKPPDVRLRLAGPSEAADARIAGAVDAVLDRLAGVEVGAVASWYPSVYEPEVRKYGGSGATDAVHRHFDVDTSVWLALQDLAADPATAPAVPNAPTLTTVMANDLFLRVLGDRDEVWDTWANLADLALPPSPHLDLDLQLGDGTFDRLIEATEPASPAVAALLATYRDAHDAFAAAFNAELEAGTLLAGPRAILPFVVQADFQRWGLDGTAQGTVAATMTAAWDPRTDLRGR